MIDKQQIQNLIQEKLQNTGYELITLKISSQNEILVEIDKMEGVDVDFCAELNHYIVEQLEARSEEQKSREGDDYSLEVGSVSLTAPFVTKMQYDKHLNHDVEVLAADGKKYRGISFHQLPTPPHHDSGVYRTASSSQKVLSNSHYRPPMNSHPLLYSFVPRFSLPIAPQYSD